LSNKVVIFFHTKVFSSLHKIKIEPLYHIDYFNIVFTTFGPLKVAMTLRSI